MIRISILTSLLMFFSLSVSSCVPFTIINGDTQEEDVNDGGENTEDENNGDDPSGEIPELVDNTLVKVLFDEIDGDVTNPERGFYYPYDFTSSSSAATYEKHPDKTS